MGVVDRDNPHFVHCSSLINWPLRDWPKHLPPGMAVVKSVPTEKNPNHTEFVDIANNGHPQFLALNRDMSYLGNCLTQSKPNPIAIGIVLKDDSSKVTVSSQALCSWIWIIGNKDEDHSARCDLCASDGKCGTQRG
jgi:hypothetical protein